MKIEVRFRALQPSDALREHATRRIHFQLGRFGHEVSQVEVCLSDVNGPRGGVDKRCKVTVRARRFATVFVDDFSTDPFAAIDLAVSRAARSLARKLKVVRAARRRLPLPLSAA